jgi:ATP-dependent helicase Lhr and Lhr-like helicase
VLRRVGDLTAGEVVERVFDGIDAGGLLRELERERRVVRLRVGREERYVAADEAGLYRDALGAVPPGGLPEAFLEDVPDALRVLVARYARTHGPFPTQEIHARYGVDASAVLRELETMKSPPAQLVRGELRPEGSEREWCDVEVLRRLRRASLAALRKEIEPADARALAAFLPSWQGVDRHSGAGAGVDRLREVLVPLQGLALPAEIWERDVLPRRIGAYSQVWLDGLCASGEVVWVGAGSLGRSSGRVALYFREDAPLIGPPSAPRWNVTASSPPSAPEHELLRARLARGPCFFTDLLAELDLASETLREALWDLVWAGEATNDAWAPLRAPHLTLARGGRSQQQAPRRRFGTRRPGAQAQVQGRWSLIGSLFGEPSPPLPSPERRRTLAELLLERYGIVTREQVLAEGIKGGFALLYDSFAKLETLGVCRRGYFIEGMGGAQFALPGAVERLRAGRPSLGQTDAPSGPDERDGADKRTLVIAAADPAQPYGAALPWPKREGQDRRPARVAGAYVVMVAEEPALYVERGGRGLVTLGEAPLGEALRALAAAVRAGRVGKLALERIDGQPAIASSLAQELIDLGFHSGPRKLTLSA